MRTIPLNAFPFVFAAAVLVAPGAVSPQRTEGVHAATTDSAAVVSVVDRFRAALSSGDSVSALALLAQDAIILESGDVESRAQYREHHLPADIEFARAIQGTHSLVSAVVHRDAAWVISTSVTAGQLKGRTINSAGAELIVLSRHDARSPWQIRAVHWSSHRRT